MMRKNAVAAKNRTLVFTLMKIYNKTLILFTCLSLGGASAEAQMRDVVTHDELSQKLRMAQQKDPIRNTGPAIGKKDEDPAKLTAERSLLKASTTIAYGGYLTFVPKRAVLCIPEKYKTRLEVPSNVKLKTFGDFLQTNRGWIRTIEVTAEQAKGHVPFSEKVAEALSESSQVVIATYKGGPISVLPLKDAEEVPTRGEQKSIIYAK